MKLVSVTLKALFTQPADSCQSTAEGDQTLEVEVEDAGGGEYFVIQTDRWAMDPKDMAVFSKQLNALLKRTKCPTS